MDAAGRGSDVARPWGGWNVRFRDLGGRCTGVHLLLGGLQSNVALVVSVLRF
jgi:hypothetical protein